MTSKEREKESNTPTDHCYKRKCLVGRVAKAKNTFVKLASLCSTAQKRLLVLLSMHKQHCVLYTFIDCLSEPVPVSVYVELTVARKPAVNFSLLFYLFYVFSTVILHRAFILSLWLSQLICFWSFRVMFWGNSHSITSWNYRNILLLRSKFYGRFLFQHKYGIVFFRFAQINGKFLLQWQLRLFSYADDKFEFFLNTIIWMMVFFFCLDNNLYIYLFKNKRINLLKKNCLAKNRSVYQSE